MSFKRIISLLSAAALLSVCLTACGKNQSDNSSQEQTSAQSLDYSDMFSSSDMETGYDETTAVAVTLADSGCVSKSESVKTAGSGVTITGAGTYIVSGTLSNGSITVDADKSDKIRLIFDGVSINCDTFAAVYVKQADKVFITLTDGSENKLSNKTGFDSSDDDNNVDAVVFSKDDLTINGNGKLTISSTGGHGIVSKDDLIITGGTYSVSADSHALSANDSVRVASGTFTLTSGKDGVHCENTDDTSLGFIFIADGTFGITSAADGFDSSGVFTSNGGNFSIKAGGGYQNAEAKQSEQFGRGFENSTETDENSVSTKGIKADGDITISGGEYNIDSADDSVHSNSCVTVGGTFKIASGDDGFHADSALKITKGEIDITASYEGIEGKTVDISGGNISLVSSDDGINAAGGNDSSGFEGNMMRDKFSDTQSDSYINISGGTVNITAGGDGVDSNGSITISGGETYVSGPENSGNGSLDCGTGAKITGGVFIAAGASGMAENFGSDSTQGAILYSFSSQSQSKITLKDSSGNEIISFTPNAKYNCVIISCPEIKKGESYTLSAADTQTEIEMTDTVFSNSAGGFAGKGGMKGSGGGRGGMMPQSGGAPQASGTV